MLSILSNSLKYLKIYIFQSENLKELKCIKLIFNYKIKVPIVME